MGKSTSPYPRLAADGSGSHVVSQAGAVLLLRTAEMVGLTSGLSQALAPWRKPGSVHDPGKVVLDLAVAVALGGDCLADIGMLRAEPGVSGLVASDPTVSRAIARLAVEAPKHWRPSDPRERPPAPRRGIVPVTALPITGSTLSIH